MVCVPSPRKIVFCCQPAVDKTKTFALDRLDEKASVFANGLVNGPNIHQKDRVPGPVKVVCMVDCWPLATNPLCAASNPSCEVLVSANQGEAPVFVQTKPVVLSAVGRSTTTTVR